jgi:hypothetical protein
MDDKRITAKELQVALDPELDALFQDVAAAMNQARAGSIIADSEEPVRDANAKFTRKIGDRHLLNSNGDKTIGGCPLFSQLFSVQTEYGHCRKRVYFRRLQDSGREQLLFGEYR